MSWTTLSIRACRLIVPALLCSLVCSPVPMSAQIRLPFGTPPAEENEQIINAAPEECLLYIRWAATRTADANSANATERLVADPETQALVQGLYDFARDLLLRVADEEGPREYKLAEAFVELIPELWANSGTVFVESISFDRGPPNVAGGAILELGDQSEQVEEFITDLFANLIGDADLVKQWGDGVLAELPLPPGLPTLSVGVRSGYLFVGLGEDGADGLLARMSTPAPEWLVSLQDRLPVPQRSMVAHFDVEQMVALARPILGPDEDFDRAMRALGIDRIESISAVGGFDEEGFVSRAITRISGNLPAWLAAIKDRPITLADLRSIPASSQMAAIAKVDSEKLIEGLIATAEELQPGVGAEVRAALYPDSEDPGAISLGGILSSLGDTYQVYYAPNEGGSYIGFVAVFDVESEQRLAKEEAKLLALLKEWFPEDVEFDPFSFGDISYSVAQQTVGDDTIRYVYPNSLFGAPPVSPAWCVTDGKLVVAPYVQNLKAYLTRGEGQSLADVDWIQTRMEQTEGTAAMVYVDTGKILENAYPYLQIAMAWAHGEFIREEIDLDAGMLPSGSLFAKQMTPDVAFIRVVDDGVEWESRVTIPGSDAVLAASVLGLGGMIAEEMDIDMMSAFSPRHAQEVQSINKLKWMALAVHNFHDVHRRLPAAAYQAEGDDRPLLSWRVQLLPYMEQQVLYDQFRFDEPWDSEHNRQLIPLMPDIFKAPGSQAAEGHTNYLSIRTDESLFPGTERVRFADVHDGLSNTIMFVEAADSEAVIWTKPDDLTFKRMGGIRQLVGLRKDGFLVALGDGSIHKFPADLDIEEVMRWVTRAEGTPNEYRAGERR